MTVFVVTTRGFAGDDAFGDLDPWELFIGKSLWTLVN
jgi:hypothetical protein